MDSKTFRKLSYGLYLVSSKKGDKLNGQVANTVFQITSEPSTIAVSINKQNLTHDFIEASKVFSVSILGESTPLKLIGHFGFKSGRELEKFKDVGYSLGREGVPVEIENTIGYFEAKVINSIDVGTHTIFIGEVMDAQIVTADEPMTYAYYHLLKQGKVSQKPKAEVAFPAISKQKEVAKDKYVCDVCGYIYDPAKGDPRAGIVPGTDFKDLPSDWKCPVCGVGKDQFSKG